MNLVSMWRLRLGDEQAMDEMVAAVTPHCIEPARQTLMQYPHLSSLGEARGYVRARVGLVIRAQIGERVGPMSAGQLDSLTEEVEEQVVNTLASEVVMAEQPLRRVA